MSFYNAMQNYLNLSQSQSNLVLISLVTSIIQLLIFVFVLKQGKLSLTTAAFLFIVFVYNVMYYKIFIRE
jgi:hypothetical protein